MRRRRPCELVLDEDQRTREVVADEALRAESDGDADDAETGDGRPDVEIELAQDHEPGDDDDEELDDVRGDVSIVSDPLADLDRRQLLRGPLGDLAVEQRL